MISIRPMTVLALLFATVFASGLLAGCASTSKTQHKAATDTPLPLDPTDDLELSEWWSNGYHLLHLGDDGFYRLYTDNNRYHQSVERGKWWQQSYATVWLETYDQLPVRPTRAVLRRQREAVVMSVRDYAVLVPLARPPVVIEDELFGRWMGGAGTLELDTDLRYSFMPREARSSGPATLASQEGRWSVEEDLIILHPNSSGMRPTLVRINLDDQMLSLDLAEGRLVRSPTVFKGG
jgi:hypothetical protein